MRWHTTTTCSTNVLLGLACETPKVTGMMYLALEADHWFDVLGSLLKQTVGLMCLALEADHWFDVLGSLLKALPVLGVKAKE